MMTATLSGIVDEFRKKIVLGDVIGQGGEGSIHALHAFPQRVVKLYHEPISEAHANKLRAMVQLQDKTLLSCAAWPLGLVFDASNPEVICGFMMPRVREAKSLHILYGPKTRREQFPKATFAFLVHTAMNVARLFAAAHSAGHVIGDVNHGNMLVSPQGTVWAIDCDSFQVKNGDNEWYGCDVGVMTHQPPELQQVQTFRGVTRTQNHDRFGLAVIIFQLLMMGRHPFAGKTSAKNDISLEQSIQTYRYVYGADAAVRGLTPPPTSIPIDRLPFAIQRLFDRAFSSMGSTNEARPTANDWLSALEACKRQLKTCPETNTHQFFNHRNSCVWCELKEQRGIDFFPDPDHESEHKDPVKANNTVALPSATPSTVNTLPPLKPKPTRADEHALWFKIQSFAAPSDKWPLPRLSECRNGPTERIGRWRKQYRGIQIGSAVIGLAGGFVPVYAWISNLPMLAATSICSVLGSAITLGIGSLTATWWMRKKIRTERALAEMNWHEIRRSARAQALLQRKSYEQVIDALAEIRTAIVELPEYRMHRMNEWLGQLPDRQLKTFLSQYRLSDAKINGIGDGRKMTLESYGIETAGDLEHTNLKNVPGIGASVFQLLMDWRSGIAEQFVPDLRAGLSRHDHMLLDREVAVRRDGLLRKLESGVRQLEELLELQLELRQKIEETIRETGHELSAWMLDEFEMFPKKNKKKKK